MNLKLTYLSNDNYMLEKTSNEIDSEGASNVPFTIETTVSNTLELHYAYYIYNKKIEGIAAKTGTNYVIPNNAFARPGQLILSVHIIDGDSIRVSNPVHYVIKNGANGAVIIDPGSPIEAVINEIKSELNTRSSQIADLQDDVEYLKEHGDGSGFTDLQLLNLCNALKGARYDTLEASLNAKAFVESVLGKDDEPTIPTEPTRTLTSITATYNGGEVEVYTSVESLDITVTAHYNDNTTEEVTDYTLSGEINNIGENIITISYHDKSTSITVIAHARQVESIYPIEGTNVRLNSNDILAGLPEYVYMANITSSDTINMVAGNTYPSVLIFLQGNKTYNFNVTNVSPTQTKQYYTACAVMLDEEPSRTEIKTINASMIGTKPSLSTMGIEYGATKTAQFASTNDCYVAFNGNNVGTIKVEEVS